MNDALDALIAALDVGDVAAIEQATRIVAELLPMMRSAPPDAKLDHAARQAEAARIRVNFLADRNRQKLDRLRVHRGEPALSLYAAGVGSRLA